MRFRKNYLFFIADFVSNFFSSQGPSQSPDDQLVMSRHNDIYPSEAELKQVQTIVATVEKALKKISDAIGGIQRINSMLNILL